MPAYIARQFGLRYEKIRISSARTRWGSCSSRGTLSFTWRLVMAPSEVLDYVVVHDPQPAAILSFVAYGDELNVVQPPRPQDPTRTWEQVYAVKVRITGDPAVDLKPGIPADVRLEVGDQTPSRPDAKAQ